MNDFVLAIIGSVGIAALAMSMNDDTEIKENFNPGFGFRTKLVKEVKDKNGNLHDIQVDQYPNITCKKSNQPNKPLYPVGPIKENFVGSGLGASNNTNLPYVTTTNHLNQTVNQPSPSLNLPSLIRYNPPSLNKMGITENFQCKQQPIRENYETSTCVKAATPYMSPSPDMVGPNYSASPKKVTLDKFLNAPMDGISPAGDLMDPFNGKEVMVFDRPMTTTLKVGRFSGRGTRDLIRGDLPVAPNSHKGWFSTPADPSALSKGALQAMGGESESTSVMNKFMELYGDASGVGSGVNLEDPVDQQYTAYEMTMKNQGVCDNTVSVSRF